MASTQVTRSSVSEARGPISSSTTTTSFKSALFEARCHLSMNTKPGRSARVYLGLNRDTDGCRCRLNARCRRSLSAHRWYLEQSSENISLPHCVSAFPYKNDICSFLRQNMSRSGPGKPQHRLNRPVKQAYQQHLLFESLGVAWGWRDANRVLTVQSDRPG